MCTDSIDASKTSLISDGKLVYNISLVQKTKGFDKKSIVVKWNCCLLLIDKGLLNFLPCTFEDICQKVYIEFKKKYKWISFKNRNLAQIREQVSGPEISWYGKSILGCGLWPGLDCGIKGSGSIMNNFWGPFFHFFGVKKILNFFFENTIASALKSYIIPILQIFFF